MPSYFSRSKSVTHRDYAFREALAQLIEFSYWIDNATAAKLVVVSQKLGDTKDLLNMFNI